MGRFRWIDVADKRNSVLSYERRSGDSRSIVVLNFTPLPRGYRIGVPEVGRYECVLSTDDARWGERVTHPLRRRC
jgi:1,4-alpha-glucan branching enzyme